MDIDEGTYAAVASKMVLFDTLPYKDGIDNKTPLIFYTYYVIFLLFGIYNMLAIHIFTTIVVLFTSIIIILITKQILNNRYNRYIPIISGIFYILMTSWFYPKMLAFNCEIYFMLPLTLAIYIIIKISQNNYKFHFLLIFISGFLCGFAFCIKQTAGIIIPIIISFWVIQNLSSVFNIKKFITVLKNSIIFILSFSIMLLFFILYFYIKGNLDDFLFWSFKYTTGNYIIDAYKHIDSTLSLLFFKQIAFYISYLVFWILLIIFFKSSLKDISLSFLRND